MAHCRPLVLIILDGWGCRKESIHNAIASAHTPQWDEWWTTRPHMVLKASGTAVGLPPSQMGNSEVGHMHIGAGRIIPQDFTRINEAIKNGTFAKNPVFLEAIHHVKQQHTSLHLLGLLSPGGVHSHEQHLFSFLKLCATYQCPTVYLHLFLDGRDTPPQSALLSLKKLKACLKKYPIASIRSICGRYYALDRDHRWSRLEPVYRLLTEAKSNYQFDNAENAIKTFYQEGIFDEFIPPTRIGNAHPIQDGDTVFFFNFRADRARQLTEALLSDRFDGFLRAKKPQIKTFISMTHYADALATKAAFPPLQIHNTLGEVIANHGLHQLRLAETEKYAHVTFFLNGGAEQVFPFEERCLIPSPSVNTYDKKPEMSAHQLTKTLVKAIQTQQYDVIICNYANADMVGHTGNFPAAVTAIETLDKALQEVWQALMHIQGQLIITADHGNAECMFNDATKQAHTAHTSEPVPFLYLSTTKEWVLKKREGSLIDIAPTILALLGITPPPEMTGSTLLVKARRINA